MNKIDYKLMVDSPILKVETKKQVEPLLREVANKLDDGELQVKVEKLPNTKYLVSLKAFFPNTTLILRKEGKRIAPIVKKLKKSLVRRIREKCKKKKAKYKNFKQVRAS